MKEQIVLKGYTFANQIQTDGVGCNLLFIRADLAGKKWGEKIKNDELEIEIKRIEEIDKTGRTLIGVDPGKNKILTMTDGKKFYHYSSARRRNDNYTTRNNEVVNKAKMRSIEKLMSKRSKRTLNTQNYNQTLTAFAPFRDKMRKNYSRLLYRKMKLRRYIRKKSSEDKLLNEISSKFGTNLLLGVGNWSNPTHNQGILKVLRRKFEVATIDEFRTSKLYYKDPSKELGQLVIKGKDERGVSIYSLLTPTMNPNGVIVNRDHNASLNILRLMSGRPKEFQRHLKGANLAEPLQSTETVARA